MTNTDLLNDKIRASGRKRGYIAEHLGISVYALAKKIKNETEFKPSEIVSLCDVLGITSIKEKELIFFAK